MKMKSDRPARARPHDEADLRHHAARQHVALEHLGIAAKTGDPLLDARAATVVEADDGSADLQRHVHHLADLFRMALRQRAAEHGEILAEHEHQPAVDRARTGDDPIAGNFLRLHAEIDAIMLDVAIQLLEAVLVEQHLEPFASRQLALGMLRVDALLPAAQMGSFPATLHFGDIGGHELVLFIFQRRKRSHSIDAAHRRAVTHPAVGESSFPASLVRPFVRRLIPHLQGHNPFSFARRPFDRPFAIRCLDDIKSSALHFGSDRVCRKSRDEDKRQEM